MVIVGYDYMFVLLFVDSFMAVFIKPLQLELCSEWS